MRQLSLSPDSDRSSTRKACALCGMQTEAFQLEVEPGAATCPLCGAALPKVGTDYALEDDRAWLERENPELFARLAEKRNRRAARRRAARRAAVLVGAVLVALLAYFLR